MEREITQSARIRQGGRPARRMGFDTYYRERRELSGATRRENRGEDLGGRRANGGEERGGVAKKLLISPHCLTSRGTRQLFTYATCSRVHTHTHTHTQMRTANLRHY